MSVLLILVYMINSIFTTICILLIVAFYTLAERKIMSSIQRRVGPNLIGFWGLLQPIADGVKVLFKQPLIPRAAAPAMFIVAPALSFFLALLSWSLIPLSLTVTVVNSFLGVMLLLAISSLGVYGIIFSGWASNSRYAFLGSIRSSSQMISYEVAMSLSLFPILLYSKSLNLSEIVLVQGIIWNLLWLLPNAIIFFISSLAETNRTPFDLPEAEAELVAGYNVEYSGFTFAFFFLAEYANMFLLSSLNVIFFFGGWTGLFSLGEYSGFWFVLKLIGVAFLFILVRATVPRYRFDNLMDIMWKVFLPLLGSFFIFWGIIL